MSDRLDPLAGGVDPARARPPRPAARAQSAGPRNDSRVLAVAGGSPARRVESDSLEGHPEDQARVRRAPRAGADRRERGARESNVFGAPERCGRRASLCALVGSRGDRRGSGCQSADRGDPAEREHGDRERTNGHSAAFRVVRHLALVRRTRAARPCTLPAAPGRASRGAQGRRPSSPPLSAWSPLRRARRVADRSARGRGPNGRSVPGRAGISRRTSRQLARARGRGCLRRSIISIHVSLRF